MINVCSFLPLKECFFSLSPPFSFWFWGYLMWKRVCVCVLRMMPFYSQVKDKTSKVPSGHKPNTYRVYMNEKITAISIANSHFSKKMKKEKVIHYLFSSWHNNINLEKSALTFFSILFFCFKMCQISAQS